MYKTSQVGNRCIAQITKRKNRLKVYKSKSSDQIFLQNNEEFEIELFNSKQNSVLAKITINGIPISSSGIVLRPGERIFLERFIDSNEKFKFSTYEIDGSEESKKASEKNGIIKIEFFDEYIPVYYNNYQYFGKDYLSNISSTFNSFSIDASSPGSSISISNTTAGSLDLNTTTYTVGSNVIETGRVERGSKSNQEFTYTTGNFNTFSCQIFEYKILPLSQKPIEISEIRNYCSQCGVRNKSNWKYCPSCGNKF